MAYPLIILGAGASYDSVDIAREAGGFRVQFDKYRPPVTNQLFDSSREIIKNTLRKYPKVNSIAYQALSYLNDGSTSLEEYLRNKLTDNAQGVQNRDKEVLKELMSLNFYLADLFFEISENFFDVANNYRHLIREIQNRRLEAYVVNFNYDLVFEKSLDIDINNLNSYVIGNDGIKILKIHGAENWIYNPIRLTGGYRDACEYFCDSENADSFFNWFTENGLDIQTGRPANYLKHLEGDSYEAYMPAIALPLDKKSKHICPINHIKEFEKSIGLFDRVIVIGWRGADDFLSNKLKEKLGDRKLPTFVISHKPNVNSTDSIRLAKEEIKNQYIEISQLQITNENIFIDGFSRFMRESKNITKIFGELLSQ